MRMVLASENGLLVDGVPALDEGVPAVCEAESSLLSRARAGDGEAFTALVALYRRMVYWHISRVAASGICAEPEDLFQEGLVGLLKAVRTYDGVSASFSTYASVCIHHSIASAVRKSCKQERISVPLDEAELVSDRSPEGEVLDRESGSLLYERVLSELSPYERVVFELYLSDLPYAQIARRLGKQEKSIANAVCRIRRKLKALLLQAGFLDANISL